MNLHEILTGGGVSLFVLLTLIQIVPIKVNPWSRIARAIGNALNGGDVMARLEEHIRIDDERDADMHRYRILRFNTEILHKVRHTEEEFNEILYSIKRYERYCDDHPEYENNRAVLAIENIERVYKECMATHDFLV
jgi:hypothetical protein